MTTEPTQTKHTEPMKILHTIECTRWSSAYQAHVQHTRHLTRKRRLTYRGIERMFRRGCAEFDADPEICVTRVEAVVYAR